MKAITAALRRYQQRGAGLAGVLAIMTIAALAAFTMAAVTMSHAGRARRAVNAQQALFLAEGAMAQAISRIKSDGTYGTHGETITYGAGGDRAYVTFDRANQIIAATGSKRGVLYSTNNIDGKAGGGSGGVTVASGTVHLVATAAAGGQTRVVEALVGVPRYPYVVSASGQVTAPGSLVLKAATSSSAYLADPIGSTATLPSNLGARDGVKVSGDCTITGDVVANNLRTIDLPPKATVGGVVRSGNIRLPDIPLSNFDPLKLITSLSILNDNTIGDTAKTLALTDSRHYRPASGTLTIKGSLSLNNAILYVDGNVVVEDAVSGRGMLVVTGDATIGGAVDLAAAKPDELTAVLVGRNMTLSGKGAASQKYFQGLVYARGTMTASNLTIAGIFMSGGGFSGTASTPYSNGLMTLDNVTAVYLPDAADLVLSVTVPVANVSIGAYKSSVGGSSAKSQAGFYNNTTPTENKQWVTLNSFSGRGYYEYTYTYPSPPTEKKDIAYLPSSDPVAQQIVAAGRRKLQELNSKFSLADTVYGEKGAGTSFGALSITDGKTTISCDFNQVRVRYRLADGRVVSSASDTQSVPPTPGASAIAVLESPVTSSDLEGLGTGFTMTNMQSASGYFRQDGKYSLNGYFNSNLTTISNTLTQMGTSTSEMLDTSYQVQKAMVDELNKLTGGQGLPGAKGPDATVTLDLNQFFGTERPLRIISWQEHE